MRFVVLTIAVAILTFGCGPSGPSTGATSSPATSPARPASAGAGSAGTTSGVRLTVDGQAIPIEGEVKSVSQKATGFSLYYVAAGKNVRNSAGSGYGVTLELQTGPTNPDAKEGFSVKDVQVATLTVDKDDKFSYMSTGAMPGRPIEGLQLDRTTGALVGSYETNISGLAGKFRARIDFNVPFPKPE